MSLPSLKNVFKPIVDLVLGKPCESGLGHRWSPINIISGNTICQHPDCVAIREEHQFATLDFSGGQVRGTKESIAKLKANHGKLYELAQLVKVLEEQNNTAFDRGCTKGMAMERAKLYNTLLQSRELLLNQLQPIGINEHRIRLFIDWYENQRDARVNPKQDDITYKVCKNIVELETTLIEAQTDPALT